MAGRSNKRSGKSGGARRRGGAGRSAQAHDPFAVDGLVRAVLGGADELLTVDDPLEAEDWASGMLGVFYQAPIPFEAREKLERSFGPALVQGAERRRNATGLAVLCALAAVTGDELGAGEAATRMAARGVARPRWADVAGRPQFLGGFSVADPFGDQVAFHLTFRYEGRAPHLIMALYDENLGGIIKDAFVGGLEDGTDPRTLLAADPDVIVEDVDPAEVAARIATAVSTGDLFVDNDWSDDFRHNRALLLARMRLLAGGAPAEPTAELAEPLGDASREALVEEFFASPVAPALALLRGAAREDALTIVDHCLIARCDFGDGDPLRWSPAVVELFMLDYLPRKVDLNQAEIDALPVVLAAWVRFALTKRGLEERFIREVVDVVSELTDEFREAMGDSATFGPGKAIFKALRAEGVDVSDQKAVDAWLADFNTRPDEERFRILGPPDF
jgi:hypothetical protein